MTHTHRPLVLAATLGGGGGGGRLLVSGRQLPPNYSLVGGGLGREVSGRGDGGGGVWVWFGLVWLAPGPWFGASL